MFIERGLKTPWVWDENAATRMLSLYKHFQFREGKLIKNTLIRSMKSNPLNMLKTVAIIGAVFPIAGEMLNMFENMATGRPAFDRGHPLAEQFVKRPLEGLTGHRFKEGKPNVMQVHKLLHFNGKWARYTDEYFDALGHLAAFGIWYSMLRSLFSGRETDWMSGPVMGFGADVITGGYYAARGKFEPAYKRITRRIPVVGPAIAEQAKPAHRAVQKIVRKF
jgi:hypothetical protein